jgi:serine protease Do
MILPGLEEEITLAVERLTASVVRVDRPGRPPGRRGRSAESAASGSGLVVGADGWIVTNDHVVQGADAVEVTFADGAQSSARVAGEDPLTDLALLRCAASGRGTAPWADSSQLKPGQIALAVGSALGLPGAPTVSLGVVSALGRPMPGADFVTEGWLQTDAAINPGNSGGPLATWRGEVMGITTAIAPFAQGVGFAVPSNTVRRVTGQLMARGRMVRPWLGLVLGSLTDAARRSTQRSTGLLVQEADPRGPAARAGVQTGDVLIRAGSTGLRTLRDLVAALEAGPIGGSIDLALVRGRTERRALVPLLEAPARART